MICSFVRSFARWLVSCSLPLPRSSARVKKAKAVPRHSGL